MKELSTKSEAKGKLMVKIRRRQGMDFVKEVVSATRTFSVDDWRRKWNVVFIGERGLDYGGLFKEMMQLLGIALFSPSDDGLFCILGTGTFGLAHPNANVHPIFRSLFYVLNKPTLSKLRRRRISSAHLAAL